MVQNRVSATRALVCLANSSTLSSASGVEGQGQRLALGRFKGGELAVDEAGRHEMARPMGHAVGGDFAGQLQEYKAQARRGFAQVVAVFLFQRGAGEYRMFTGFERTAQFIAQDVEPTGAVVVVEGGLRSSFRCSRLG